MLFRGRLLKTFDADLLKEMLRQIKDGERFGIGTDVFAAVFPPSHTDAGALAAARSLSEACRCDMDYWRATNEVFYTKRIRRRAGRHATSGRDKAKSSDR
jgi:hypothetical protein